MSKRRKTAQTSGSGRTKKKNYLGPVLRLLLALIIVGLIWWFWPQISDWATATWEDLLELFGIGLLFTAVFIGMVIFDAILGTNMKARKEFATIGIVVSFIMLLVGFFILIEKLAKLI